MPAIAAVVIPMHGGHAHVESYGWSLDPLPLAGLILTAAIYGVLVLLAHRRAGHGRTGHRVSRVRIACFGAGLAIIAIALFSPIDPFGEDRSAAVHMLQHELLLMVAPLLLVLGVEQRVALPISRVVMRGIHVRGWRAVLEAAGNPWFTAALWGVIGAGWHIPAAYGLSLAHPGVHIAEHLSLLATGTLFWASIVGRIPAVHRASLAERIGALGIVMAVGGIVGAGLLWAPAVLYSGYEGTTGVAGMTALADQHAAGALMMAVDMPLLLGAMILVVAATKRDATLDSPGRARAVAGAASPATAATSAPPAPTASTAPTAPTAPTAVTTSTAPTAQSIGG
ncbi:cytochrome c oxidase assembly protein [Pseudactinotalea sp. HY160]|uniref:cytochrome c oxidase assembly protein n=1 Tax=Pseudactinotalea sp. HY160 TaxID=2654490 RepID=UPI0018838043|nr:cytochrome c oxidase assembly protein [Pseudactinotalea sp. HY160]